MIQVTFREVPPIARTNNRIQAHSSSHHHSSFPFPLPSTHQALQKQSSSTPSLLEDDSSTTISHEVRELFDEASDSVDKPIPESSDLLSVHSILPASYWTIIPYEYFNRVQSATAHTLFHTDENVVVSAPTVFLFFSFFSLLSCAGMW